MTRILIAAIPCFIALIVSWIVTGIRRMDVERHELLESSSECEGHVFQESSDAFTRITVSAGASSDELSAFYAACANAMKGNKVSEMDVLYDDCMWAKAPEETQISIHSESRPSCKCAYCGCTNDHIYGTCDYCGAPLEG